MKNFDKYEILCFSKLYHYQNDHGDIISKTGINL